MNAGGSSARSGCPAFFRRADSRRRRSSTTSTWAISQWEIDLFGRIRNLSDAALEQYFAVEQARVSAQIALLAEVANVYLALAADRENLELARSTLETQLQTYEMIRRRAEVGASSDLDLRQAQTRADAARVDIARYTSQVALDENALRLLVGSPVPPELLPDALDGVAAPRDFTPGLPSEVLQRRPDILQAEAQLRAAHAKHRRGPGGLFPPHRAHDEHRHHERPALRALQVRLRDLVLHSADRHADLRRPDVGGLRRDEGGPGDRPGPVREGDPGGIPGSGRHPGPARNPGDQLQAQQSLVEASEVGYRLSDARYTRGIDSYLRVLDAQRSLYSAQQGLIAVRLARLANLVALYKVLGEARCKWGGR